MEVDSVSSRRSAVESKPKGQSATAPAAPKGGPLPVVKIDNTSDPFATLVSVIDCIFRDALL